MVDEDRRVGKCDLLLGGHLKQLETTIQETKITGSMVKFKNSSLDTRTSQTSASKSMLLCLSSSIEYDSEHDIVVARGMTVLALEDDKNYTLDRSYISLATAIPHQLRLFYPGLKPYHVSYC